MNVTVSHALEVLNAALDADPVAISKLFLTRVECNDALADDPTIQCGDADLGYGIVNTVGPLGILNGIFGIHPDGRGHITAIVDRDLLVGFEETR